MGKVSIRWRPGTFWSLCCPGSHTHSVHSWRSQQGLAPSGSPSCTGKGNNTVLFEGRARRCLQAGGTCPRNPPEMEPGCPTGVAAMQPCHAEYARDQERCVGSLGSFLEMQRLRPHPDLGFQNLHLKKNVHATCMLVTCEKQ